MHQLVGWLTECPDCQFKPALGSAWALGVDVEIFISQAKVSFYSIRIACCLNSCELVRGLFFFAVLSTGGDRGLMRLILDLHFGLLVLAQCVYSVVIF